jgi:hypothetical protein
MVDGKRRDFRERDREIEIDRERERERERERARVGDFNLEAFKSNRIHNVHFNCFIIF